MIFSIFFDNEGSLKYKEYASFFIGYTAFFYVLSIILYSYYYNGVSNPLGILSAYYYLIIENLIEETDNMPYLLHMNYFLISFTLFFVVVLKYSFFKYHQVQKKLHNMGLYGYYLFFRWGNTYYFKPHISCKIRFDVFIKQFENLTQLFSKGSANFERFGINGIKVIFINEVPSIQKLAKINIIDYLQKDKIFLGFKGSIKNKLEAVYLPFHKLLHTANLGATGKGKSNTLNQILLSIFYNFNNVHLFVFIDYKGGIESQTYEKLEEVLKTGRIETYKNNRFNLFKLLRRLTVINLARQKYIVAKGIKKIEKSYIYLMLDEVAAILNYKPLKEDKEQHEQTVKMLEDIFSMGRSQGLRVLLSTQSYVGNASSISGIMKTNIETKITHFLDEESAITSIFPDKSILEKQGIRLNDFEIGEFVVKTEGTNLIHARSCYVPEKVSNLIDLLKAITNLEKPEEINIDSFIKEVLEELPDSNLYSNSEVLEDLTS